MTGPPVKIATDATPGAMVWVVRVGITLFLVPFFVVGFGLLFGGPMFGGFGWFGPLLGLPFVAVPGMMLLSVWISPGKAGVATPNGMAGGRSEPPSTVQIVPETPATVCTYCGAHRRAEALRCESCGAA
jgi:hypothetical protein